MAEAILNSDQIIIKNQNTMNLRGVYNIFGRIVISLKEQIKEDNANFIISKS